MSATPSIAAAMRFAFLGRVQRRVSREIETFDFLNCEAYFVARRMGVQ